MCSGCYKYEALGKKSSRQEYNELYPHHFDLVMSSLYTGKLEKYDLKSLDFRFSNICNLKCRTCSHFFSSKWFEESKILGCESGSDKSIIYAVEDPDTLWGQVKQSLNGLERIHFAGGEPLMMEEHYKILEYLIEKKKFDVQISYNTNFAELQYKNFNVVELWKSFRHISVFASLDAMDERGEYMRKGISWTKVEENRQVLKKEVPHVSFTLTPTISLMNALHLPDFYENWLEKGFINERGINVYVLFEPYFYNVATLDESMKSKISERYARFFEDNDKRFSASTAKFLKEQFQVVLTHMYMEKQVMPPDYYNGHNFNSYNGKLDELRKEDFYTVFPELRSAIS